MNRNKKIAVGAAGGTVLLILVGSCGFATGSATAEPETVTVTETPEPVIETVTETPEPVVETVTEEVEVPTAACVDAVSDGAELIVIYSEALTHAADSLEYVSRGDFAGLDSITADVEALHVDRLDPALDSFYMNAIVCDDDFESGW